MLRLQEMATLRKRDSKLPVNVWIDDSLAYKRGKHGKRIKFQADYGDKPNTRSCFASMNLNGEVIEKTKQKKGYKLQARDEKAISNFVLNNKECLELISDMELDWADFKQYLMITGPDLASKEEKEAQLDLLQQFVGF